jgi:hypothetical protein
VDLPWAKLIIGALFIVIVLRMGFWILGAFAMPAPKPPPEGEMRKIDLRYRCSICGTELRMMVAPTDDPEPPRHCLEDMDLVAPIE